MTHAIGEGWELRGSERVKVSLLTVRECPEGIARRCDDALAFGLRVLAHGWPERWDEQPAMAVEAVEVAREVFGV